MLIICHYGELSLKGGNRKYFEQKLAKNIRESLKHAHSEHFLDVKNIHGRLIIRFQNEETMKPETLTGIKSKLKDIFGLVHFSIAQEVPQNLDAIQEAIWKHIQHKEFSSFRVTAKRSNKNFPFTSQEINEKIGAFIYEKSHKKVDLSNPDLNCFIEIVDQRAFIYFEKEKTVGGMPVGSSSKALVLLSGGIDSPVASWYIIKRGAPVDFIHFHSMPYTSPASIEKVKKLAQVLNRFQPSATMYLIPFAEIQKEVMMKTPQKLRVIFYRRLMMKIAEAVAKKYNYAALVTGDSLGQVASQTLENMAAVEEAASASWRIPVLRPLIGFDKEEIMAKAREIGTFDISILPHDDCCTRFIPEHPETKAKIEEVKLAEKNIAPSALVRKALKKMETVII